MRRSDTELVSASDLKKAAQTLPASRGSRVDDAALGRWALHVAYSERREPLVLAALVDQYGRRAVSCARRFERRGEPIEDLIQVAYEALVKSLQRFDPSLGLPFLALATPTMEGALKHHFRDRGYLVHVPRRVHETVGLVTWGEDWLRSELEREPTVQEIADLIDMPVEEVRQVLQAEAARNLVSFESGSVEPTERRRPRAAMDRAEDHAVVVRLLRPLERREREVLYLYYFEEQSQATIARRFGVSQMQVCRWLSSSTARMRSHA